MDVVLHATHMLSRIRKLSRKRAGPSRVARPRQDDLKSGNPKLIWPWCINDAGATYPIRIDRPSAMTTGSAYAEAGQFTNAASPQKEPVILCSSQKLKNEYLSGLKGYELR